MTNTKYKVLFLLHLPPPVHGSSMMGLTIRESLEINNEFDCSYINLLASKHLVESGKVTFNKIFGFVITFIKLLSVIIRNRPTLCYLALTTTGAAFFKDLLLVAVLRFFKIKRIYHLHNKGVALYQHKIVDRLCYQFVFHEAQIILLSNYLYKDIQKFVLESNVHICPNGISDQAQKLTLRKERFHYKISINPVQILFLSNLIESKGVFILLEACAILKAKKLLFKCVFVGGEADITASSFKAKVKQLDLMEQVTYEGKKYGDEKTQVFENADIFAFPTFYHNETFGLVLLEAMQFSLPVVSTLEGGIPDVVEDGKTGFLVPQQDSTTLARKLSLLITQPALRREMGENGRMRYHKYFTLNKFEEKMCKILSQSIRKGSQ